ncbi:GIY-YIG nuclease family protein [Ramlibacter montanisoli]|uniref:GIY-YIG nuclease family protein n=1 Tax=Ramlibacter montanisoli TaxID=2732512 RepID=A0A849KBS8_9BURK|nr:GIY-YIG nuclease family protein [Ramlibacter montanisoli]NNU43587.1 GIY-YIG nuclease family protein [Ramlibacter montanisoli]
MRNTPGVDALFEGKRKGPTPQYARLSDAGVVPVDPAHVVPQPEEPVLRSNAAPVSRYAAREEFVAQDDGLEWLYIYSTAREIDNFVGHGIEPLVKIGCSRNHYTLRISQQAGSTAAGTTLVCLYAYRLRNAHQAESSVHHALKLQGKHVKDAPGIEWFEVRPQSAHKLVEAICGSLTRTPRDSK